MLHTIKGKMVTAFLLAIIVPIAITCLVVYFYMDRQMNDNFVQATTKEIVQVDNSVSIYFDTIRENVKMMANNPVVMKADATVTTYMDKADKTKNAPLQNGKTEAAIYKEFQRFVDSHPNTSYVYMATIYGGYISWGEEQIKEKYDPRIRPWYKEPMDNPDKVVTTAPYVSSGGTAVNISNVTVVKNEKGAPVGVVGIDASLAQLTDNLKNIKIGSSGYVMLLAKDGTVLANPKHPDMNSKNIAELKIEKLMDVKDKTADHFEVMMYGTPYMANLYTSEKTGWKYIAFVEKKEMIEGIQRIGLILIFIGALLVVIAAGASYLFASRFSKPIHAIVHHLQQMGEGDFTHEVQERLLRRKDEIGTLGQSLQLMQQSMQTLITEVKHASGRVVASSEHLSSHVEQSVSTVNGIASTVERVADGAESQLRGAVESARAMEEMALGIQRIAETTSSIAGSSADAEQEAKQGNGCIQQAIRQMGAIEGNVQNSVSVVRVLGDRSQEIVQIADVIKAISTQTNLLALNAAIEAARAGEHGRGFAVVAGEVRKLAEQSSESAGRISRLIQEIQGDTQRAIQAMDSVNQSVVQGFEQVQESGEAFGRILQEIQTVNEQIQDASAASEQMSAGSEEVAASVDETAHIARLSSEHVRQVANASEEQLSSVKSLSHSAGQLNELAQELNRLIDRYKV
ncbi:methyl-accepting chemotaxis protein [Paenibacillus sp. SYP-B3998]|uniref:Methyl-accepting chemotaxis protein n=1 Tax=Paenibacillus sp. SYP-B3998 TaxID=2678564 RepID=A0A6G4A370_9BACL|nr:methyl-accepting chemotaxis protein [Paenibacillus sp. SYP-B3998]NEW08097.1 methyl-accepting chemotaxis protein [Paenibacillus sp. SYP-B3998]